MPALTVNGAELHHDVRGGGPPVLLIMGATGDGGHFDQLAQLLADEFTVVSYDRRGNGRSPRPAGWTTTSPEEQADDAAGLLAALGLAPAAVFGTSSGATFALALAIRHPEAVRGVLLHEPVMTLLTDDPATVREAGATLVREALEAGGPPAAVELFWRMVAGDAGWTGLEPALRERMLRSADTFIEVELGTFEAFLPGDETLAGVGVPVELVVSDGGRAPWHQAAGRLAERLGTRVVRTPGSHAAYHDHPHELAETIRPFLRDVQSSGGPRSSIP
jgi:pimeloyl-ACP methyl ester carboxylesterase